MIIEQKLGLAGFRSSKPQGIKDVIKSSLQTDSVMLIFEDQRARASEGWMFRDFWPETANQQQEVNILYNFKFGTLI